MVNSVRIEFTKYRILDQLYVLINIFLHNTDEGRKAAWQVTNNKQNHYIIKK